MLRSKLASLALAPLFLSTDSAKATALLPRANDTDGSNPKKVIEDSELLTLHRDLCEIESISNTEQKIGEFLVEYLESHGFKVEKQEVPFDDDFDGDTDKPRFNVFASPKGGDSEVAAILTTHMDTVPPHIPYSVSANETTTKREDISIHGRGTVDAKAGIAALTIAAIKYREENPDSKLGLLFVVSEENSGTGMRHFSDSDFNPDPTPYKALIFSEPTNGVLASGHKGTVSFTVNVTGEAGHSGYPWLYSSAVSDALPILERLDQLGNLSEEEGGLPSSEKFGNCTVNVATIDAGEATNVVPPAAVAQVLIRVAAGTPDRIEDIVRKAVKGVCAERGIDEARVSLSFEPGSGPTELDSDVDGFETGIMHYGTDIPRFEIKGDAEVKRYLFGPGSIRVAHGEDEGLTVGELEKSVEAFRKLIDDVLT